MILVKFGAKALRYIFLRNETPVIGDTICADRGIQHGFRRKTIFVERRTSQRTLYSANAAKLILGPWEDSDWYYKPCETVSAINVYSSYWKSERCYKKNSDGYWSATQHFHRHMILQFTTRSYQWSIGSSLEKEYNQG